MPARHCLPWKLEQVVKTLGIAAGQNRMSPSALYNRFDLQAKGANLAELDSDSRRPSWQ